ncbi:SLC5 family protein [Niveispirillum cyanobacteriorum]|uniref:SLC5 family protein n=1 Tax=Niveispirillum cyanobacteriorum TaxID=1612173 RepID=UPI0016673D87|nr:SLC5 family protein [Niveispirillum cyanobacteriorum]GGE82011.1 solute:sodium symporter family transporter [Niveispirillum cyanobacteriorum]
MQLPLLQVAIAAALTALVAGLTVWKCRRASVHSTDAHQEYFLAGRGLSWFFIAGSITITNLSTEQLVGMNGNQMALLAWWELAAVVGLGILALVFLPIYYRYNCTTTTELLEKKYGAKSIRSLIGGLFTFANVFISMPIMLYSSALFLKSMFGLQVPLLVIAIILAMAGSLFAILGGLRAVAVADTYSGVLLLTMGTAIVFLALAAINWDFSGIPAERLTMIGGNDSPIPWHTLLTGMIFIQIFYWSTNQTITQRAMAAPTLREAQKGVLAAATVRFLIIPPMVVLPGIVSYKLYGDINDAAYGTIAGAVLPEFLTGIFAAALVTAVLAHFASVLNSTATLYVCDIHEKYFNPNPNVPRLGGMVSAIFVVIAILLVPVYSDAESIINLVQQLNGLTSMPILSAFIVGLLFRNVDARAAVLGVLFGVGLYAIFTFVWTPLHYIHLMFITLWLTVGFALTVNRVVFGRKATFILSR